MLSSAAVQAADINWYGKLDVQALSVNRGIYRYADQGRQLELPFSRLGIKGQQQLNDELERRVAARTYELLESNRNLQRQIAHDTSSLGQPKVESAAKRLRAINPAIQLQLYPAGLDADSLSAAVAGVDLVLDCSDNFGTREAVNAACVAAGKPLVSGAAIRLEGQLAVFDPRQADSPCYHCLYGHGSEAELTCSEAGVLGPLVGLVGSLQALEALKLLAGFGQSLVGRLLLIDGLGCHFRELRVKRDPACSVCGVARGE